MKNVLIIYILFLILHFNLAAQDGASYSIQNDNNLTKSQKELFLSIQYDKMEEFKLLISQGVDINIKDSNGETPLHSSISNKEITKILLEKNADPNAKSKSGDTPFIYACGSGGDIRVILLLIKYGADIKAKNNFKINGLHQAASYGNLQVIKFLIKNDLPYNELDDAGRSPLQYAVRSGHFECVEYLLNQYEKSNERIKNFDLLLRDAISLSNGRNVKMISLLLHKGTASINNINSVSDYDGGTLLHKAVQYGNTNSLEMLKLFLKAGVKIDTKNKYGETALQIACKAGFIPEIDYLMINGANIDQIDDYGNSLLHIAVESRSLKLVQYLIAKKVKLNEQDVWGHTPLHIAVFIHNMDVTDCLLKAGANTSVKSKKSKYFMSGNFLPAGITALDIAKIMKYNDIIELFSKYQQNP